MSKIITVITQKGGVGKTATAYNTSYELATQGKKTLLVDLDPSHNSSDPYIDQEELGATVSDVLMNRNLHPEEAIYQAKLRKNCIDNLYVMPSSLSLGINQDAILSKAHREQLLLNQLSKIEKDFDFVIIDSPNMISKFSAIAIFTGNFILIPLEYAGDALLAVHNVFNAIEEIKINQEYDFKVLRNNLDARLSIVSKVEEQLEPLHQKGKVFKTIIRKDESINLAKEKQLPVLVYSPKCKAADDYKELSRELLNV